jgi:shikimate kinase
MKVSIIGMSGSGKSYWSKELEEQGFTRFCCDDLIEKRLSDKLIALGYAGIQDVAKWMGQPFDPQYPETSSTYLHFEKEVLDEVLRKIEAAPPGANMVLDTTGSIIYTGKDLLGKLARTTRIIYLNVPASVTQEMYENYLHDPKPVVWENCFTKIEGETETEALGRCYSALLASRAEKYRTLANVTIDYPLLRSAGFGVKEFLAQMTDEPL